MTRLASSKLVLVADDVQGIADALADLLSLTGYRALRAYSGAEALAVVKTHTPDAIILDLDMPGLSGSQVCVALSCEPSFADTRWIALTPLTRPQDRAAAKAAGFHVFLTKPVSLVELIEGIERKAPP